MHAVCHQSAARCERHWRLPFEDWLSVSARCIASDMLKEFGQEIWTADGPDVAVVGFRYPTRMAAVRLSDGSLFIWSPIQLTASLRAAVDALGPVQHIVAPNSLHHLFLPVWKHAYPGAKVYAPPGLRKKRADIIFDADLGNCRVKVGSKRSIRS
jgi:Domain of unknown function (DUF4336)